MRGVEGSGLREGGRGGGWAKQQLAAVSGGQQWAATDGCGGGGSGGSNSSSSGRSAYGWSNGRGGAFSGDPEDAHAYVLVDNPHHSLWGCLVRHASTHPHAPSTHTEPMMYSTAEMSAQLSTPGK